MHIICQRFLIDQQGIAHTHCTKEIIHAIVVNRKCPFGFLLPQKQIHNRIYCIRLEVLIFKL